ncbi:phosphoinositide-specific phospholipase C, putative [Plasmodium ovale]|uniref:Phosphoinositide phospholipase C n=2 Tax=Plasmodium ovale TaxID=36330 RepID=A0A1A8W8M8_PLAOA|nr:phosphoinositide-specific phospholipase C, putative (PI-PLC) [Plasmodium ovale curtisi]SBS88055.1 phosphoinositide-specific phospholipase C, putative (PI-PLC) [Plasmodium ovale curtisi]SCP04125.1 phosphoinositide-specific phospholipase C, putative [Plasmodium ovale]
MSFNGRVSRNAFNEEAQENDDSMSLLSEDAGVSRNEQYGGYENSPELSIRKKEREIKKNNTDSMNPKLGFDIRNVLTHAYLPACIEKMKEGEYVYKWNSNNIFQKKTLKFFYLDVNNYCIRWNSKKKRVKENKHPSLYMYDIIKILDGSESIFFKKKEEEKNLSIEIISTHKNLRITFLDIQRWKMWLFGLMYYQYKLVNKGSEKKKIMKPFIYENNRLYDNYIISGLKDINALTLSQLYIILRSLNIYLNMKILYHYFSIYKNKGIINYLGFTKILEHIFSNNHITTYFNLFKDENVSYMDKRKFIHFLIEVQCEGKCEERIFYPYRRGGVINPSKGKDAKGIRSLDGAKGSRSVDRPNGRVNVTFANQEDQAVNEEPNDGNTRRDTHHSNKTRKNFPICGEHNFEQNYERTNGTDEHCVKHHFDNHEWEYFMRKLDSENTNESENLHLAVGNIPNALLFSDNSMHHDEDFAMVVDILRNELGKSGEQDQREGINGYSRNYIKERDPGVKTIMKGKLRSDMQGYDVYDENCKKDNVEDNEEKEEGIITYGSICVKKNETKEFSYMVRAKVIYKLVNTIKKYNIPFVMINDDNHYLTQIGLVYFLLSKENSIMCPEYSKVYQNMNLPLCNYWINSSHNSYLGRKQIFSSSNIEQYIYILIDGCRCVEFDCYYFNKNIVVYHGFYGYKLTSSILFCDTLIACKMFGFTTSPFPIILSLEIHCKNKHKNLIAKILICILGNQLYIPKTRDEINNITPNNCKNKFLVKYKHFDNSETSGFYNLFEGLKSVMYDELGYMSDIIGEDDEEQLGGEAHQISNDHEAGKEYDIYAKGVSLRGQRQKGKKKDKLLVTPCNGKPALKTEDQANGTNRSSSRNSGRSSSGGSSIFARENGSNGVNRDEGSESDEVKGNTVRRSRGNISTGSCTPHRNRDKLESTKLKNNNILNEYSCLKGYVFQSFHENRTYNEICSISENKFTKLIKKNEKDIIRYNQKTLTRVYPSGTRLASTNFNPLIFWSAGIQFVALNYQYNGLSMLLNKGRFLENGGKHSGYILKPELLRYNDKNDYNILFLNIQILSLHQINLLFSIKNKYQEKKLKKKLFKMDMMQRIQTHKKINKKIKNVKDLQKLEREKKHFPFSDIQSDDNKKKNINHEILLNRFNNNGNDNSNGNGNDNNVNYIHNKCSIVEKKYEDMLSEYKSFLLCSSLSHSSSFNSCSSNTTTSNNTATDSNKNSPSKLKNKSFYHTFEELKKANNLFFYLYVTISVHGYNEQKYYFKTEIAKVNFYDLNYCWPKPSTFQMKISYPSLALIVFELKAYDTVKSDIIACACFPVKCLREGIRFVPLCDKYLKDLKGSGILVNLKIDTNND